VPVIHSVLPFVGDWDCVPSTHTGRKDDTDLTTERDFGPFDAAVFGDDSGSDFAF
jgi:hypothetical protein